MQENCGVFGIFTSSYNTDVASQAYLALFALQHRGQESCGIAVCSDGLMQYHSDLGLVPEVFSRETLDKLGRGNMAVGHVRYSPMDQKSRSNAQPLVVRHIKGSMAIAHNGSITNANSLREKLQMEGAVFHTSNDSEIIISIITKKRIQTKTIEDAIDMAMHEIEGAYSLVIMSPSKLIAARDPYGFRPLCMGSLNGGIVFASESCALDSIGADFIRDIEPGEIVVADKDGTRSIKTHCGKKSGMCVFEYIYFARPDSVIEGSCVHNARQRAGSFLALEHPVQADVVFGVPDSGLDAALGYSRQSGIPYGVGFIKNRYIGRTFIQPTQEERDRAVRIKLNTIESTIKNKRVVLIDDSIVRGTTMRRIVKLVRETGAKEVHLRISSPPFINPCYFGTDIDSRENLIACKMSITEIREYLGADSLGYLSIDHVPKIAENAKCGFCDGCFTGKYPVPEPAIIPKSKYDQKIGESN
ncbi:MAG: amidophosphoribosyltransferase [Treponema sp.]|nr:amidophosphoribosyltransferase [Treponema sp.]MCL2181333.1 amidophosphoribosyltransferase [Treponema sp.]